MARKLRVQYPGAIYHVMNRGDRRELIFMDDADRQRFVETLGEVCAKTGWLVHAYVLMPNHFHVLVTPAPGHELKNIIRSWKGFSARRINKLLGRTGAFWQAEAYDHIVRSEEQFGHYRRYIANNPVKARLKEEDYVLYGATPT